MVRTFLKVYTEPGSYPNGYMAVGTFLYLEYLEILFKQH
jgi:hypothetical protein